MPIVISDATPRRAGRTEREAIVEVSCRLFDAGKLHPWPVARMAGLGRVEFESGLMTRKLPILRPMVEDLREGLAAPKRPDFRS